MRKEGSAIALAREYRRAIINHCLECSGGCRREVEHCRVKGCALWEYRMGAAFAEDRDTSSGASRHLPLKGKAGDNDTTQMSMLEMLTGG